MYIWEWGLGSMGAVGVGGCVYFSTIRVTRRERAADRLSIATESSSSGDWLYCVSSVGLDWPPEPADDIVSSISIETTPSADLLKNR